jgi:hypothetical protein
VEVSEAVFAAPTATVPVILTAPVLLIVVLPVPRSAGAKS